MSFRPADILKYPFWTLALATGAKSFRDNKVIGSQALNRRGLHEARARTAYRMAEWRRARLASLVSAEDAAAFQRDGFILKRDYLPADVFEALKAAVTAYEGPAREMLQGDTITRRMAIDSQALQKMPPVRDLIARPDWRGMMRYVASFDQEPLYYIQTILSHVKDAPPDPQTDLHADTFHPSLKAWYFLTDVAEDEGPFVYLPGSHRMTPERLAWERDMSIAAAQAANRYSSRGSFRASPEDIARMKLGKPQAFAVPANTLVVADTVGFHARGFSARPTRRLEIWAYSRRNPFIPWTGLDLLSAPGIAERRIPALWRGLDLAERAGARRNPWRDAGIMHPLDEPNV